MNAFTVFVLALVYSAGVSGQDSTSEKPDPQTTKPPVVTTEAPHTTTEIATTTAGSDGPTDEPPKVNLILNQSDIVCLMITMQAKFNFTYNQTYHDGNKTRYRTEVIYWDVPADARVTNQSRCNATSDGRNQLLVAEFFEGWLLKMHFSKNKDDQMTVDNMTLEYIESSRRFQNITTPNATVTSSAHSGDFTWSEDGFRCTSDEQITGFNHGSMTQIVYLETSKVTIEAFRNKRDAVFGKHFAYCAKDTNVSNIVPIAVGAALAGLVLIVLVAYLIGRSRNKRGYESV